jgi:hypothetical protein
MQDKHPLLKIFDKDTPPLVKLSGIFGALIVGAILGGLALFGISVAYHAPVVFKVFLTLLAFFFGAAIGGGIGVWISELCLQRHHPW